MYVCITLNPPLSLSRPVTGYRWLARWHGISLSRQEPAICLRFREKLFSLLGKHMPVPKVAATSADSFTSLLSAFALFIRGHLGRWLRKMRGRNKFINLMINVGLTNFENQQKQNIFFSLREKNPHLKELFRFRYQKHSSCGKICHLFRRYQHTKKSSEA